MPSSITHGIRRDPSLSDERFASCCVREAGYEPTPRALSRSVVQVVQFERQVVVEALVTTGRRWTAIPRSSSVDSDASASQRAPWPRRTLHPQLREPPGVGGVS
ncbi:hypothetical protein C8J56DRAFT_1046490 [Mycena floridula]|nr:hypothetical protein C8J56DRAFT_1046490 [Mycena floridula]